MRTIFTTALVLTTALVSGGLSAQNGTPDQGQAGNASPARVSGPHVSTVNMLVAEGYNGRVRSNRGNAAMLNVDATPRMQKDGRISLQLTVEYRPRETAETLDAMSPINESLTVLLQSGKPLIVTQAADPSSDRKVTVEVTATILK